jgi:hypothetical protein
VPNQRATTETALGISLSLFFFVISATTKGNNVAALVEHVYTEALHYVFS